MLMSRSKIFDQSQQHHHSFLANSATISADKDEANFTTGAKKSYVAFSRPPPKKKKEM